VIQVYARSERIEGEKAWGGGCGWGGKGLDEGHLIRGGRRARAIERMGRRNMHGAAGELQDSKGN